MQIVFILCLLLTSYIPFVRSGTAFSALGPSACATNEYFNLTLYSCEKCSVSNTIKSSGGISCQCDPDYYPVYSSGQITSCAPCGSGIWLPYSEQTCTGMDGNVKRLQSSSEYVCNSPNQFLYVNREYTLSCAACSKYTYSTNTAAAYDCFSCSHPRQRYQQINGKYDCYCSGDSEFEDVSGTDTCGVSSLVSSFATLAQGKSYSVNLDRIDTDNSISGGSVSVPLQKLDGTLKKAWFGCQYSRNATDCQMLANLCVLAYYNKENAACSAYNEIALAAKSVDPTNFDEGWKESLPWLYYLSKGKAVSESDRIKTKYAISSNSIPTNIELWVGKYSFNGTFLGYSSFDREGFLCHVKSIRDTDDFKKIGRNYDNRCDYDLSEILNMTDTSFYELFIKSTTNTGKIDIIDIPTRVINYDNSNNKDDYKYVRRFFVYDNICTNKASDPKNSYIKWAYSMTLRVQLKKGTEGEIYVPTLTIEYRERTVDSIKLGNKFAKSSFSVIYFQDYSKDIQSGLIALIILTVVAILVGVYRIYVWFQSNPSNLEGVIYSSYIKYAIWSCTYLILHSWAVIFFWYLFGIAAYYYLFFKLSERPSIFLPDKTDYAAGYKYFDAVFGTLLAVQFLCVILKIISQCSYDVFLIDWETPKLEERQGKHVYKNNAWRGIMVANEFCEAMSEGFLSVTLNYIIFIFFLFGVGWEYWSQERPGPKDYQTINPENVYLSYFVQALVFLVIAAVDYMLKWGSSIWLPPHTQDVVDLMSVANISVIIFDELLKGYYIHGQSPGGKSDANAEELKKIIDGEMANIAMRKRGLDQKDMTEIQTFEIYAAVNMRQRYNEIRHGELKNVQVVQNQNSSNPNEREALNKQQEISDDTRSLCMNQFLQEYIMSYEQPKESSRIVIEEKTYMQYFFGIRPTGLFEQAQHGTSIFLKDPRMNFMELSGLGIDFHMTFLRVLVFWFWDRVLDNKFYALFFTYLIEKFIWWVRTMFVKANISEKSLMDDRFLS